MELDLATIQEIIRLERLCEKAEKNTPEIDLTNFEEYLRDPAVQELRQRTQELEEYMNALSYDTLLDVEALMRIGRDLDYSEEDPFAVRFQKCRDHLTELYPDAGNKEAAIDYLCSKGSLATYLCDGAKAVGIELAPLA